MTVSNSVKHNIKQLKPFPRELPDLAVEEIKARLGLDKVYKLSFNENSYGPSPAAVEAMQRAACGVNFYPSSYGLELTRALAGEYGVDPDNLILSNGADEMINLVAQTFAGPGDKVIFPSPSFGAYAIAARVVGAEPIAVPLTGYGVDLNSMLDNVSEEVKLIYVCNPNNPTGTMLSLDDVEGFLREIPPHIMVIFDEAYMEFTGDPEKLTAVNLINRYENIGIIRTFSKIYGLAGARVGYLIAGREIIDAVHRVRPPFNVNGVAQAGALAALKDHQYIQKMREINNTQREYLESEIKRLGMSYIPSCTNFIFMNTGRDAGVVYEELARRGIVVRPGSQFGENNFIRVTVGSEEANREFINALEQIIQER